MSKHLSSQFENANSLANHDLVPVEQENRTWRAANYASMWMSVVNNIPTYAAIGGLIVLGFSPVQVLAIVFIASMVLYAGLALNGHAGTKYGIPFPVFMRTSYGVIGANVIALMRGFVAIIWLGIQAYAGSSAIYISISLLWPGWGNLGGDWNFIGINLPGLICFLLFWSLHIFVLKHGMESLKKFQVWTGPLFLLVLACMLFWVVKNTGGFKPIFAQTGKYTTFGEAFFPFISAVAGIVGIWSTLILNIPDFTRFAKSQKDQAKGQLLGLPTTFLLFTFMTVSITAGTAVLFGQPMDDVVATLNQIGSPIWIALGAMLLAIATITVNVVGNIVSPSYDFANVLPKYIDFKRGFYLTMFLALFTVPWKLLENATVIFTMLNIIGACLGPVAGVMIADYYILRRRNLNVDDLYSMNGEYTYYKGFNYRAFLATGLAALVTLLGLFVPSLKGLYDISWFVGVLISFSLYLLFVKLHPYGQTQSQSKEEKEFAG